uniref:Ig-like domain-containing protein n=1 Tax=Strigamia maritima TaxID=126957 RepID=T1J3R4_STRMM
MSGQVAAISLFFICIVCCSRQSRAVAKDESLATDNVTVTAVLEHEAHLPCNIAPASDSDKAHMVFWYREMSGSPFYSLNENLAGVNYICCSLDVRNKPLASAEHALTKSLKKRLIFNTQQEPAHLLIHQVRRNDEGIYRCRVDFRSSPTRYFSVNLTVIIPPAQPIIFDEHGVELNETTNSLNEQSHLFLSCESSTGRPEPALLWWRDDVLVDDTYHITPAGGVRNDLAVAALTRRDFRATYTCQASNNNLSEPAERSVFVNMNLKPLQVEIQEERRALSAGKHYELKCRSSGSRPPPVVAWWMGDKRLKTTRNTVSIDTNISTSVLTLRPVNSDNGKYLSCRAENPLILNSGVEDGWTLDIYFVPVATLELGGSLKDKSILEGDDVYFECHVLANPFVHSVKWKFYSRYLATDLSAGIIVSKLSLVIRSVKRDNVGPYTCLAINKEGGGESNPLYLQIRRSPFCKTGQKLVYGVARNEAARISCQLDAFPEEISFNWAFNNSFGEKRNYNASTTEHTRSTFLHIPRTENDFGYFYCWGTNEMGSQVEPCIYRVVTVEIPDPVTNCTVYNRTLSSFYVECRAGYDGGLPQHFILDIFDVLNNKLRSALLSPRALFYVSGLRPRMRLRLHIYASNSKGRSDVTEVSAETLKLSRDNKDFDIFSTIPLLGVLSGVVVVLLSLSIGLLWIVKCRGATSNKKRNFPMEIRKELDGENDEKCPDVIPSRNGKESGSGNTSIFHTNTDQEFPPVTIKCLKTNIDHEILNQYCIGNLLSHMTWENSKMKPHTDSDEGMNLQCLNTPLSLRRN